MAREIIESAKIVIKTDAGNRLEVSGKGSAPRLMLNAFLCLPKKRREWLLNRMQEAHEEMAAKEAQRQEKGGA